ncbi:hypothetical protein SPRG_13702 [Saprolegnia parasitica CBS 223.65]|uniref:Uncharacterized protein n=1 Tax=Saprolegnia parasitica (strain CBS 223.65) TaxID=695850 RepID=A0A067BS94_SAPPC|nr:hypothetical protein SPRG_13702 [Saprolegnia parasitica CBS 223.65]KDO21389.1 hypothetical protein SPRG_13702 [Saprolegnia parasitica CBS 223.65]|eukprot:XP_012207944.1 hypothetical protein SPRG_13702 [Saprolegnia parasitica CBS 223.65]
MLHALEDIIAAVDRHLVGKEKIAAIERSSPMGLTQLKRYIKMKKETGAIVVGKVGARKKYVAGRAPKKTAAENGFETCGAWPLSLVAMDKHVEKQKVNGVRSTLDIEAWIKLHCSS